MFIYSLKMKQFLPDVADRGEEQSPVRHDEVVGSTAAAGLVVDAPLLDNDPRLAGLVQEDAEVRGRPRDEAHLHAHEQPQGEGHRVGHKVQLWNGKWRLYVGYVLGQRLGLLGGCFGKINLKTVSLLDFHMGRRMSMSMVNIMAEMMTAARAQVGM